MIEMKNPKKVSEGEEGRNTTPCRQVKPRPTQLPSLFKRERIAVTSDPIWERLVTEEKETSHSGCAAEIWCHPLSRGKKGGKNEENAASEVRRILTKKTRPASRAPRGADVSGKRGGNFE